MIAQVGRPFEADGIQYESGDIVDATGWPRLQRLRTLRYLLPAPKGAEVTDKSVASAPAGQDAPPKKAPAPTKKPAAVKAPAKKAAPRKAPAKKAAAPRKTTAKAAPAT